MTKALSAGLILKKNTLDPQSSWLELYEVEVGGSTPTLYLTNHPTPVLYGGKEYAPYPIRHGAIREEAHGELQKITLHVANVLREVQYYLEQYDGLRGKKVAIILVNQDDLTLGDIRQSFIIEATTATEDLVTLTLGKPIPLLEVRLPARIISRDLFPSLLE